MRVKFYLDSSSGRGVIDEVERLVDDLDDDIAEAGSEFVGVMDAFGRVGVPIGMAPINGYHLTPLGQLFAAEANRHRLYFSNVLAPGNGRPTEIRVLKAASPTSNRHPDETESEQRHRQM